ncbi:MAG: hypothetical protein WA857_05695 [Candidatus Acidiferrum sp.]
MAISLLAALASACKAQSADVAGYSASDTVSPYSSSTRPHLDLMYVRPTEKMKLRTYVFDAFGPYPIVGAALIAGINQADKTPPEWGQGAEAYGQRFGSDLGIAAITTTTRYALAEAFREDTVYYRCECKGVFRRMRHALISTVTARHGEDGERRLSFPALVAPYAGTMTAVYAWYPERYGAKDALRMGNYTLLAFAAENVALEFLYGGPHTLFSHLHRPESSGTDAGSSPSH